MVYWEKRQADQSVQKNLEMLKKIIQVYMLWSCHNSEGPQSVKIQPPENVHQTSYRWMGQQQKNKALLGGWLVDNIWNKAKPAFLQRKGIWSTLQDMRNEMRRHRKKTFMPTRPPARHNVVLTIHGCHHIPSSCKSCWFTLANPINWAPSTIKMILLKKGSIHNPNFKK